VHKRKGNDKLEIYVDGQQVDQVSQFRYLGIFFFIKHVVAIRLD